eukprot:COSAG05_NODE_9792_length_601_cov_0.922311_1_plen_82_part_10
MLPVVTLEMADAANSNLLPPQLIDTAEMALEMNRDPLYRDASKVRGVGKRNRLAVRNGGVDGDSLPITKSRETQWQSAIAPP